MIQVFKIFNRIDDINCEKFFEFTDYDGTRNSHTKLYIQYAWTQSKKCTFSWRSAPVLNTKLSQLSKCCSNVIFFKRLLDKETFLHENKLYFDQYWNLAAMNLQCESKYIKNEGTFKGYQPMFSPYIYIYVYDVK